MKGMSRLLWWLSSGYRSALIKSAVGAIFAVGLTVGICALGNGARVAIQDQLMGGGDQLRVKPPSYSIGAIDLAGSLLPERKLDADAVAKIAEVEGVDQVLPEIWSRFPVSFRGRLAGQRLYSDGALLGVSANGIGEDFTGKWTWKEGDTVPVLAPRALLMAYNGGFAPANGLPKLKEKAVRGLKFKIIAGQSTHKRSQAGRIRLQAEIVGVTSYGGALAGIVPLEVIEHFESELDSEKAGTLSSVMVRVEPGADSETVVRNLQKTGWAVESLDGAAKQLATAIRTVDLGVRIGGGILALSALFLLVQFYGVLLRERTQDLRILRSMGAPKGMLAGALVGEIAVASVVATLGGILLGLLGGQIAAAKCANLLADRLGVELSIQAVAPGGFLVGLLILAPIFVGIAAIPAIRRALAAELVVD
jgi:ABC-type antimicrobial peptide transport system permease subunit